MGRHQHHRRGDYGGLAMVFSELSQLGPVWKQALEGWNVQESPQVLEWQREAHMKGTLEGQKEYLKRAVPKNFGPAVDNQLLSKIDGLQDPQKLDPLFDAVLENISLADFEKLLNGA